MPSPAAGPTGRPRASSPGTEGALRTLSGVSCLDLRPPRGPEECFLGSSVCDLTVTLPKPSLPFQGEQAQSARPAPAPALRGFPGRALRTHLTQGQPWGWGRRGASWGAGHSTPGHFSGASACAAGSFFPRSQDAGGGRAWEKRNPVPLGLGRECKLILNICIHKNWNEKILRPTEQTGKETLPHSAAAYIPAVLTSHA